jgi:hypothetical protein
VDLSSEILMCGVHPKLLARWRSPDQLTLAGLKNAQGRP